jgi:transcriptional regulator with XRE-family HTH domain
MAAIQPVCSPVGAGVSGVDRESGKEPSSARELFGAELRRLRLLHEVSQEQLAALVVHSRALIAAVELAGRWPPRDLAVRCDEALHSGGTLIRLWPLVDAERQAARQVLTEVRLSDLRTVVLRLAVLTGTDLSVLTVAGSEDQLPDAGLGVTPAGRDQSDAT